MFFTHKPTLRREQDRTIKLSGQRHYFIAKRIHINDLQEYLGQFGYLLSVPKFQVFPTFSYNKVSPSEDCLPGFPFLIIKQKQEKNFPCMARCVKHFYFSLSNFEFLTILATTHQNPFFIVCRP